MDDKRDILSLYFYSKSRLEELPPDLEYHRWMHTKTFFDAVCYLAELEGIDEKHTYLLKVAALYHDRGYAKKREDHELESATIANDELPGFGFDKDDTDFVVSLTLSTKMPTSPKNIYEMIMCDADLEPLGRDYFPYVSELLRKENGIPESEWLRMQIKFLESHEYYTESARKLFNRQKKIYLENLRRKAKMQREL